jgi:hypothetical protein
MVLVENLMDRWYFEQLCIGERIILNLSTDETGFSVQCSLISETTLICLKIPRLCLLALIVLLR